MNGFKFIGCCMGLVALSVVLSACIILPLSYLYCVNSYEDSMFKIPGVCLVEYQGKYIPEPLYKKAFEQNFNLNLK